MKWLENFDNNKTRSLLSTLYDFVFDYFHSKYLLKLKVIFYRWYLKKCVQISSIR